MTKDDRIGVRVSTELKNTLITLAKKEGRSLALLWERLGRKTRDLFNACVPSSLPIDARNLTSVSDRKPPRTLMSLDALIARVTDEVKPYTMASPENLALTIRLAVEAVESGRAGHLVECGTWMGGSSFAMLLAQRYGFGKIIKPVWMFDSFQGLPPAEDCDGPLALKYQRETDAPGYYDNCRVPSDQVLANVRRFAFSSSEAIVVEGWFEDTLPKHRATLDRSGIALLRLDCDWYKPVSYVLAELAQLVSEEGAIILDDYYAWDGCARATHDYLSHHSLSWRIRSTGVLSGGAWLVKRAHRVDSL